MPEINASNDTETPGGAPALEPECSLSDLQYPNDFPEFEDVLLAFSNENPEYRNLLTERTRSLIKDVFLDENNEVLPQKTINKNREQTRVRIYYILKQLEQNERWRQEKAKTNLIPEVKNGSKALRISASEAEFKASPRTILKTLQEIFTPPTEKMAFQRDELCSKGKDMSCIVIDPASINATKLRNLGLEEYIPEKGKRMTPAERMAFMARAIPDIKEILSNLESIRMPQNWHESDNNYFRLMRIGSGKKEGYVLGTQVIRGKKTMFVTDIHKAYRRLFHIMGESYKQEIKLLRELETSILKIHADLEKWPMGPEDLESTRAKLHEMADSLKYVEDEDKVRIKKLIDASVELKTSRTIPAKFGKSEKDGKREVIREKKTVEQVNPKATRARLYPSRIRKSFQSRVDRIRRISSHLSQDNVVSEDYIIRQQIPFDKIMDLFESKTVGVNMDRTPTVKSSKITESTLDRIDRNCSYAQGVTPPVEPYLSFSRKVLSHTAETRRLIEIDAPRIERASEYMKVYFVAKIQRFYQRLQHVYGRYISPSEIPDFEKLSDEIGLLEKFLFKKEVRALLVKDGQKNEVFLKSKSYSVAYGKLDQFIKEMLVCSREAAKLQAEHPENTDDLKRLQKTLREHVKGFDFPELIAGIQTNPEEESDYVIEEI